MPPFYRQRLSKLLICSKLYRKNSAAQTLLHLRINLRHNQPVKKMQILIKTVWAGDCWSTNHVLNNRKLKKRGHIQQSISRVWMFKHCKKLGPCHAPPHPHLRGLREEVKPGDAGEDGAAHTSTPETWVACRPPLPPSPLPTNQALSPRSSVDHSGS